MEETVCHVHVTVLCLDNCISLKYNLLSILFVCSFRALEFVKTLVYFFVVKCVPKLNQVRFRPSPPTAIYFLWTAKSLLNANTGKGYSVLPM